MEEQKATVQEYLKTLREEGNEAAAKYVQDHFGVDGTESFKAEEYEKFVSEATAFVIDYNAKMVEDLKSAEAVEEEVKDEADA